ncbi:MAG: peptidoglycan DD-metalloendopeptidase family protein [Candidatus Dormibacteria bacterium]
MGLTHAAAQPAIGTRTPRTATAAPFLTRPYWHAHTVTSIFDHCNPDYTQDGKVCEFDGTVALKSNGADPSYPSGYAVTSKGTDYLYYDGHNGWDYALWYEPVVAAAAGTVQSAGIDGGFGLSIIINHGNGYATRYAHLSQLAVSPGQSVLRGQGIGTSGNTGSSSGPHLHFGVYLTAPWTAIDPWGWTGSGADPWAADTGNLWIGGTPTDAGPVSPTGATATVSGNSVTVKWTPGTSSTGGAATMYTITSSPTVETLVVPGSATSATLRCLPGNSTYTFTVTPANGGGSGSPSAPSNQVTTGGGGAPDPAAGTGGYNVLNSSGAIYSFCDARYYGNLLDHQYPGPGVGLAETPDGGGYNILTTSGALYSFGNAPYMGNLLDHAYPGPATAIAFTPDGAGYAILTASGGIYNFGQSAYYGNLIDHHYPGTAVGLAYTSTGRGYSILTREGGIYSFGDAAYYGNLIDHSYPGLAKSIANTRDGQGYAIMASDGTIYPFGSQPYFGSLLDHGYPGPAEALSSTP